MKARGCESPCPVRRSIETENILGATDDDFCNLNWIAAFRAVRQIGKIALSVENSSSKSFRYFLSASTLDRNARGLTPTTSRKARVKFDGLAYPSAAAISSTD